MGKLTSYLIGLTAAILLSYYVLFTYYTPIINWLGPVVGSDIIFPFGFLFLLLGSSLTYPIVLMSWIVIGVAVGLGSRKGTRAIGAAISIYFTIWGFLALSVLSVVQKISGISLTNIGGTSTGASMSLPPLPPGTSISAILAEPVVNSFSSIISSLPGLSTLTNSTGGGSPTTSIFSSLPTFFYNVILPPMITNIVVFMVISGVTGTLIYRLANKNNMPSKPGNGGPKQQKPKKAKVKKVKTKKVVRKVDHVGTATLSLVFVAVVMMMLPGPVAVNHNTPGSQIQSSQASSSSYLNASLAATGQIFSLATLASNTTSSQMPSSLSLNYGGGYVGRYGNIYNIYAFLNSSSQTPPTFFGSTSGSSTHPILSVIFASSNLESIFNSLKQDGFISASMVNTLQSNQLYNIIPQALVLEIYAGNVNTTSSVALQQAGVLSSNMGGTSPVNFLSLNLPISNSTVVSLFAYSISIGNLNSESSAVSALSPYFSSDGMVPAFQANLQNGYLIPGSNSNSVDGSLFIAGHMDTSQLPGTFGNFTNFLNTSGSQSSLGNIYFMGGLFVKQASIHSSASSHKITGDQVFNYNSAITFGSNQSIYAVSILYPGQNFTSGSPISGYNMVVYSNFQNFSGIGNASNITYIYVPSGSSFSFTNVNVTTNYTFPASLKIAQSVTYVSGNTYKVSIKLTNNDTDVLNNVEINAGTLLSSYGSYASVSSGSTTSNAASISPGQSLTATFEVQLNGVGSYVVAAPTFNYTMNNNTFSVLGNTLVANAQVPSVFQAFNQVEYVSFSTISNLLHFNYFVQQIYPGLYVFDLIILLIVVLDVYIEVRAFKRWNARRKGTPPPQNNNEVKIDTTDVGDQENQEE